MHAARTRNPILNESTETALASLLAHGRLYTKKPALPGFHVYYSSDPNHVAYNPLEDVEYSGAGIYMVGLLDEVWKIGSFEKLVASYVIDTDDEELEITEGHLLETAPPNGADLSPCLAIRYRSDATSPILAARVPLSVSLVEHYAEDGACYTLHANKPFNSRGASVAHGQGDMLACSLVIATADEDVKATQFQIGDIVYKPKVSGAYIINGMIFERTYATFADYRIA